MRNAPWWAWIGAVLAGIAMLVCLLEQTVSTGSLVLFGVGAALFGIGVGRSSGQGRSAIPPAPRPGSDVPTDRG